jgi:hypothetical protein
MSKYDVSTQICHYFFLEVIHRNGHKFMQQHLYSSDVISPILMGLALQQLHEEYLRILCSSINLRHQDVFEILCLNKLSACLNKKQYHIGDYPVEAEVYTLTGQRCGNFIWGPTSKLPE